MEVPLREHIEERIVSLERHLSALENEREKRLRDVALAQARAVEISEKEFSKRLELHNELLRKMERLEGTFATIEMYGLVKADVLAIKGELSVLRSELSSLGSDISSLKSDMLALRGEIVRMRTIIDKREGLVAGLVALITAIAAIIVTFMKQ